MVMSNKTWVSSKAAGCLLLALDGPAQGDPLLTSNFPTHAGIDFSMNPVFEEGSSTITGTLGYSVGGTVASAEMSILKATNGDVLPVNPGDPAIGDPVPCGFGAGPGNFGNFPRIAWVEVASGTTNASGGFSTVFNTIAGMGGNRVGFVAAHPNQIVTGGNFLRESQSACIDLVIDSVPPGPGGAMRGATIAVTRAEGDGIPSPAPSLGSFGPWTFRITVKAWQPLTRVTAWGGANGWAAVTGKKADVGTVKMRKTFNDDAILLWTLGGMARGQIANLDVTVSGAIPVSAHDCELRFLSGAWSVSYGVPMETERSMAEYGGRVAIAVDADGDGNLICP
jgi:hypothetical protein